MSRAGPVSWALVSVCRDLGTFVKRLKKSTSRLHDNRASPVSRDPGIAVPGSRLTGLRFLNVIALPGQPGSVSLCQTKIKLAPVSQVHLISHQPGWLASCNTGLKVISGYRSIPDNRAGHFGD